MARTRFPPVIGIVIPVSLTFFAGTFLPRPSYALPTSGSISGHVLDENGSPIPGERVGVIAYVGAEEFAACSDPSTGQWAIGFLPLDTQIIVAGGFNFWRDCGSSNYLVEYWQNSSSSEGATRITLTSGTPDFGGVDFRLARGAMISGTVRDSARQPILGKRIGLIMQSGTAYQNPVPPDYRQACSDPTTGTYSFRQLIPGSYVIAAGFYFGGCGPTVDNPPHNYVLEMWEEAAGPGSEDPIIIVTGGQVVSSIDFTLDEGGTISGTVRDSNGLALPAIWVQLDDASLNGACSDAAGAYTIVGVPLVTPHKIVAGQIVPEMDPYNCQPHGYAPEWWQGAVDAASATAVTLPAEQRDRSAIDFTLGAHTPQGTNVTVQPTTGVSITYTVVSSQGVTEVSASETGPAPPSGFQLGDPPTYYELTTTATLVGDIEVCIDYGSVSFADENELKLYHFEGGVWVNVTTSLDIANDTVCGTAASLSPFAVLEGREVGIDIKPGGEPNSINPQSKGTVPVAILSAADFNALAQLNRSSLKFGRTGQEASLQSCDRRGQDVNGDGLADLVCHFKTRATGFETGDAVGVLRGKTISGSPFIGRDSVHIVSP